MHRRKSYSLSFAINADYIGKMHVKSVDSDTDLHPTLEYFAMEGKIPLLIRESMHG